VSLIPLDIDFLRFLRLHQFQCSISPQYLSMSYIVSPELVLRDCRMITLRRRLLRLHAFLVGYLAPRMARRAPFNIVELVSYTLVCIAMETFQIQLYTDGKYRCAFLMRADPPPRFGQPLSRLRHLFSITI